MTDAYHGRCRGVLLALISALLAGHALADEKLVKLALAQKDYSAAFKLAKYDLELGIATPAEKLMLGQMYTTGDVTPQDLPAAKAMLSPMAEGGLASAQFLLSAVYVAESNLGFDPTSGTVGREQLKRLAARPVSERAGERLGHLWLSRAAAQHYPDAVRILIEAYARDIGEGNRDAMEKLFTDNPLDARQKTIRDEQSELASFGPSLVSLKLYHDMQTRMQVLATVKMYPNNEEPACRQKFAKVSKVEITKPLEGAQYLDVDAKFDLVRGIWSEDWTLVQCDRAVTMQTNFIADGMGGATYEFVGEKMQAPELAPVPKRYLLSPAPPSVPTTPPGAQP